MTAPCRDCRDRAAGCHASCVRYGEYRAAWDVRRKERLERRKVNDYTVDQCIKNRKATRQLKGK